MVPCSRSGAGGQGPEFCQMTALPVWAPRGRSPQTVLEGVCIWGGAGDSHTELPFAYLQSGQLAPWGACAWSGCPRKSLGQVSGAAPATWPPRQALPAAGPYTGRSVHSLWNSQFRRQGPVPQVHCTPRNPAYRPKKERTELEGGRRKPRRRRVRTSQKTPSPF